MQMVPERRRHRHQPSARLHKNVAARRRRLLQKAALRRSGSTPRSVINKAFVGGPQDWGYERQSVSTYFKTNKEIVYIIW